MQSLEQQFEAWVRTKPADEEYRFHDNSRCAVAQFLRDNGFAKEPICSALGWWDLSEDTVCRRAPFVSDAVLMAHPTTFGALADRLSSQTQSGSRP